ncbi:MAG: hypothetical protein KZQ92_02180 [Candidatus Thiodiazotropha sp. (ex Lucinoma borealis)]|nr:hypothetical protein [Candidatus Thiodiazotropha sp. (ex Lucinoma borealis)]MCU7862767.1 hypothetical protein [Candidatus Thiodiazotropha sp. (ex Lucinoma borealis)]MCU7868551.1 hypothetical protein [Candidatus Thiodiazotropha sp. (ex Lucinoma borealis)]
MDQFQPALSHGSITEVFDDVFFVSGAMETVLQGMDWKFSRNMTVVRDGKRLIIVNSVRLGEEGMTELDQLGQVTDVVRLGALHGRDDPFYVDRYNADYWVMPGMEHETGLKETHTLTTDAPLPISDASLFAFNTTQIPEGILRLDRAGGILISCDALQNWLTPDEYFSDTSRELMQSMGFFTPANLGPVWVQRAEPAADDFARLKKLPFKHALCGHGDPLCDTAHEDFSVTFNRMFSV